MKQHPIPQDVTGYKFHLIGNMTLKQFAELIGGAIIALIIYSTNLIGIVKWPLFIFVILLTVMIAFVPIEERPLDHWIITFIKNLWRPTKFFWKKTAKAPDFFNYQPGQATSTTTLPEVNYSPARQGRIKEYLQSIPNNQDQLDDWDKQRQQQAQQVLTDFDQIKIKANDISVEKKILSLMKWKEETTIKNSSPRTQKPKSKQPTGYQNHKKHQRNRVYRNPDSRKFNQREGQLKHKIKRSGFR